MYTVGDLVRLLDDLAPFSGAAEWDPVGLQIGDLDAPATTIGVCHEVTEAALPAARAAGVDVLIAYHPVLFAPVRALVAGPTAVGRALTLARNGVSLIVTHTAFDVAPGGTAEQLATALGLSVVEGLAEDSGLPDADSTSAPIGRLGTIDPVGLGELATRVASRLRSPAIRVAGDRDQVIGRVAVVPGSGSDFVAAAAASGAQVLITGDVSHHRAVAARDAGLAVIDAGHIPTERPGLSALVEELRARADGLDLVDLTTIETDPWG